MKYRQLYAFLLALIFPFMAAAADGRRVAADFFRTAPVEVASGLSEISRLDMIDYFNHGSSVRSENRFGSKIALRSLTDDMVVWQDDDSVTTALAVLAPPSPLSSPSPSADTVLVVIRTVPTPFMESRVSFYDVAWQPLSSKAFPNPGLKGWLIDSNSSTRRAVEDAIPFMIITVDYNPATQTLVYTDRTSLWFVESERPEALRFLRPQLRYRWNGKSFVLEK